MSDKPLKPCFGDFMGKTCQGHYGCVHELDWLNKHNLEKGECECKYKANCHIPRQHVQTKYGGECDFKYYFENGRWPPE